MLSSQLLEDQQIQSFLRQGYLTLQADLPVEFHAHVHREIRELFAREGNPGNDILPRVPEIYEVLWHPAVHGALSSLLGPDYLIHPHRHCHQNTAGSSGQHMHQDSYEADENVRHHRIRWLMAFYYPQDVNESFGPSSIVPESQFLTWGDKHGSPHELPVCGRAGTFTIVHYDLWHRAMANRRDRDRFMVKFLFTRMSEPHAAAWRHNGSDWPENDADLDPLHHHLWDWLRDEQSNDVSTAGSDVRLESEAARLHAVYRLAHQGDVDTLLETTRRETAQRLASNLDRDHTNPAQLDAAFGLTAAGSAAVPAMIDRLTDEEWILRASAADVLGDIGTQAAEAVPALTEALGDESEWVRRNAAEALGIIGNEAAPAVDALSAALADPFTATRHNAVLSLMKIGGCGGDRRALTAALEDDNNYVRELSALALERPS
ncbi:MAG: HEAT repeat domain-containing protein [Candidatus Latescibacterota bacterium]|nr:HEAT repeat domain-containing protein [Candidatus Latescibacterota bacterium]